MREGVFALPGARCELGGECHLNGPLVAQPVSADSMGGLEAKIRRHLDHLEQVYTADSPAADQRMVEDQL